MQKILCYLAFHLDKLSNIVNYEVNKSRNYEYKNVINIIKYHWRTRYLAPGSIQQMVAGVTNDWISYKKACTQFQIKNDSSARMMPRPPGYRNMSHRVEIIFTRDAINIEKNYISLKLAKATADIYNCNEIRINYNQIWGRKYLEKLDQISIILESLRQIRFKWYALESCWKVRLIYERSIPDSPIGNKNVMAIDIGLNNLCAITFRYGLKSYLINGRPIKSINRYINYKIDQEQSKDMKKAGTSRSYLDNKHTKRMRLQLENSINNYMHQTSKRCVEIALLEKCKLIVIGDLSGIKKGHKNRSFVQIPLQRLVELIKYKAAVQGLQVVMINEAYTSICSAIDLDEVKYCRGKANRRIFRGAFISDNGLFINSDINGSLNILRKFLNHVYERRIIANQRGAKTDLSGSIPELISFIRDKGYVVSPKKLQILQ